MINQDLEDIWTFIHLQNQNLQKELTECQSENEKEHSVTRELFFQKREMMMTIWNLEAKLKAVHDSRLMLWAEKQEKIAVLNEKIEELTIRLDCKQHVLEDLAAQLPVYEGDSGNMKYRDELFLKRLSESNANFGLKTIDAASNSDNENKDVHVLEVCPYVDEPLPERPPVTSAISADETPAEALDTDPVINDFSHLYNLKMYLLVKCGDKKTTKIPKKFDQEGFKAAVTKFCDSAIDVLTRKSPTLTSDLSLTAEEITAHFEMLLDFKMNPSYKAAYLKAFQRLLNRFLQNESSIMQKFRRCSVKFFQKFRRGSANAQSLKLEAARLQHQNMLKEKIRLEEVLAVDLQIRLENAEEENAAVRKTRIQVEGDLGLLKMLLGDAEDNLKDDAESFRVMFEEQDREILRLKESIQDLEANIELKDLCIEFIANSVNPSYNHDVMVANFNGK